MDNDTQAPIITPTETIPPQPPVFTPSLSPENTSHSKKPIITVAIITIFILGSFLLYSIPKLSQSKNQVTQKELTPTMPTVTPTVTTTKTKTFTNDFIKFSYPETAKQSVIGKNYNFVFSTGNFISYSMSNLGSLSLESWITQKETCGTSTSRKGNLFTTSLGITGIRIKNLGSCPPGGSSVSDSFYFTTGKTIHILHLHQVSSELNSEELSSFTSLLKSISLATDTTGNK